MNPTDILNMTLVDLKSSQIDKDNNIIRKVAILSTEALDTDNKIFRKFTDRAMNDAITVFNGALARIDHDRDNQSTTESRGVRTGYGVYQNVRREGNKIFGDLHLWDCENARKVMSIAERTPNAVGNSIHAGGIIRENDDGIEIVEQLTPRTKYGFKPSIDLVEDPAATISLYQSKRNKTKKKENIMEWKDVTLDGIKTNRPDLYETVKAEGFSSRDSEIESIEQERDDISKKLDELQVKQSRSEREIMADRLLLESELPDYAKTDIFRSQLLSVKEIKDGDKTISIEDGIKTLIQDRIDALEPNGVHDNNEKNISQDRKKGKVDDDDFIDAFGRDNSYGL